MRFFFVAGSFFILSSISAAQYEFTFSGYVIDFPMYQQYLPAVSKLQGIDRRQFANISRLRLRPAFSLWPNAEISAEYEITSLYSTAIFQQQTAERQNRRQIVDLKSTPVENDHWQIVHFIDRLQYRQSFSFTDVILGRQRIAWGTGRIWNPTDLFNPLNPTTVAKIEKDGVDALTFKIPFGQFTDLSLVWNPQKGWATNNAGFRFRTNYKEFDLSLVGGSFDQRFVVGLDFAGNLFGGGIRGEGIVSANSSRFPSNYVRYILGADYQITAELYALIEYHFNGEGTLNRTQYDFQRLAFGHILNVGRDYFAVSGSYLIHPLVTISSTFLANLNDRSTYCNISASISITDEFSIVAGGQIFLGSELSEYWYFPDVIYLKADIFF